MSFIILRIIFSRFGDPLQRPPGPGRITSEQVGHDLRRNAAARWGWRTPAKSPPAKRLGTGHETPRGRRNRCVRAHRRRGTAPCAGQASAAPRCRRASPARTTAPQPPASRTAPGRLVGEIVVEPLRQEPSSRSASVILPAAAQNSFLRDVVTTKSFR